MIEREFRDIANGPDIRSVAIKMKRCMAKTAHHKSLKSIWLARHARDRDCWWTWSCKSAKTETPSNTSCFCFLWKWCNCSASHPQAHPGGTGCCLEGGDGQEWGRTVALSLWVWRNNMTCGWKIPGFKIFVQFSWNCVILVGSLETCRSLASCSQQENFKVSFEAVLLFLFKPGDLKCN